MIWKVTLGFFYPHHRVPQPLPWTFLADFSLVVPVIKSKNTTMYFPHMVVYGSITTIRYDILKSRVLAFFMVRREVFTFFRILYHTPLPQRSEKNRIYYHVVINCHHPFFEMGVNSGFEIYGGISITIYFSTMKKQDFFILLPIFGNLDFY